jgi:serine/threonine protein phosphatase PrpC
MAELFWMLDDAAKKAHANAPPCAEVTDAFGTAKFKLEKGVRLDVRPDGTALPTLHGVYMDPLGELDPLPVDFGCAAVVSIVVDGRIVTGAVGDAGAVALTDSGSPIVLTPPEHTLANPDELARIRALGDVVEFTDDGFWRLRNQPGTETKLTRSLGHEQLSKGGMLPCPAISVLEVSAVASLALCSGGVTAALRPEQLVKAAGSLKDSSKDVAERLVLASQADESADFLLDDCTVALVKLREVDPLAVPTVNTHTLPVPTSGAGITRARTAKQRMSQRRKKGAPPTKNSGAGQSAEWTVKDSAWAWGLGSFRVASISTSAARAAAKTNKSAKAAQRKPSKSEEIRAKIAAEDERVRELEARMSLVMEADAGAGADLLAVPRGRLLRSDTLKSERYGFK